MNGEKLDFYNKSEAELYSLASGHLHGFTYPLTQCTSWAASLHAVLCYATYLSNRHYPIWVAIIDTSQLPGVLVFYIADLIGYADLEYQAYGHIHGPGYKAVEFDSFFHAGLLKLFSELDDLSVSHQPRLKLEAFGYYLRQKMFHDSAHLRPIEHEEVNAAVSIGYLFKGLGLPVASALICLRPRLWLNDAFVCADSDTNVQRFLDEIPLSEDMLSYTAPWLQLGIVNIGDFPRNCLDVEQWIVLMEFFARKITLRSLQRSGTKRRGMEIDIAGIDKVTGNDTEVRDWSKSLRPRLKKTYVE